MTTETMNGNAKLTDDEAEEIRSIVGWPQRQIARLYGIAQQNVSQIRLGEGVVGLGH